MVAEPKYIWHVVQLVSTDAGQGWNNMQREVVARERLEDAQRIVEVLIETSLGDEVLQTGLAVRTRSKHW